MRAMSHVTAPFRSVAVESYSSTLESSSSLRPRSWLPAMFAESWSRLGDVVTRCPWSSVCTLLTLAVSAATSSTCPQTCFCNTLSRIVYCSRRGLAAVPDGIASNSLQLNLNGNVFASSTLRRGNFSGLSSLEHLYLSECGIARLEVRFH